jgi:hypothetical protein
MDAFHFFAQAGLLMEVILGLVSNNSILSSSKDYRNVWLTIVKSALFFFTTVIYRIYLHPLAKYPGPKLFATTRLAATYYGIRHCRVYKVGELHNKYGPVSFS